MKITAKVSFAGRDFNASSGQVLDLPDEIAKDLIGAGYAEAEDAKDPEAEDAEDQKAKGVEDPEAESAEEQDAEETKDEDKRNNAGTNTKSAPRKRASSK